MDNTNICQSCGMPLAEDSFFGTDKDGGKNDDYCAYCYKDGSFTSDVSMEEMIAFCADGIEIWGIEITREDAVKMMEELFPTLKRWVKA